MEIIGICIAFGIGVWTYIDSQKRGRSGISSFLWGAGVFLLLIVFLSTFAFAAHAAARDAATAIAKERAWQYQHLLDLGNNH